MSRTAALPLRVAPLQTATPHPARPHLGLSLPRVQIPRVVSLMGTMQSGSQHERWVQWSSAPSKYTRDVSKPRPAGMCPTDDIPCNNGEGNGQLHVVGPQVTFVVGLFAMFTLVINATSSSFILKALKMVGLDEERMHMLDNVRRRLEQHAVETYHNVAASQAHEPKQVSKYFHGHGHDYSPTQPLSSVLRDVEASKTPEADASSARPTALKAVRVWILCPHRIPRIHTASPT